VKQTFSASSNHAADELVDVLLTVAPGTTSLVGVSLLLEALKGGVELEGPQEVVGFLEVGTDGNDLMDEVFNARDTRLAKNAINDGVVIERNSGAVNLTEAAAVDELLDGGAGGVAVGDEGLNVADHVPGGLVKLDESTVVELAESEELHDLLLLGGKLVDTSDSDDKCNLGLGFDEEVSGLLGTSLGFDECLVGGGVLTSVLLGILSGEGSLFGALLLGGFTSSLLGSEKLGIAGRLLLDVLWYNSCPKTHQQMS
jgi:hypothetical protein